MSTYKIYKVSILIMELPGPVSRRGTHLKVCPCCFGEYKINVSVTGQCTRLVKQRNLELCPQIVFFSPNDLMMVPPLFLFAHSNGLSSHSGVRACQISVHGFALPVSPTQVSWNNQILEKERSKLSHLLIKSLA